MNTDTHVTTPATHDPWRAYAESKLCVVLIAPLRRRVRSVARTDGARLFFFATHPGAIVTRGSERARSRVERVESAVLHAVGARF